MRSLWIRFLKKQNKHRTKGCTRMRTPPEGGRVCATRDSHISELLKVPAEEKLRLLGLLWESLSVSASALPLSDAHRSAIDEALAKHSQAPDDVLTLEQVLSGVRTSSGA